MFCVRRHYWFASLFPFQDTTLQIVDSETSLLQLTCSIQAVSYTHLDVYKRQHTIKNPNTKMSKAAMMLNAERKLILTGTPIQNHLSELWNLFQFINPGLLGNAEQFKRKYIIPIEENKNKERQGQLKKLISPFLLRRTKGEVIEELPEKNDINIPVELTGDELVMYELYRKKACLLYTSDVYKRQTLRLDVICGNECIKSAT